VETANDCYRAGEEWDDKRFNPYAEQLMAGMVKEAQSCYLAGSGWCDERFEKYVEEIIEGFVQDPNYFSKAIKGWSAKRQEGVWEKLSEEQGINYQEIKEEERGACFVLASQIGVSLISQINLLEFQQVAKAYNLIEGLGEDERYKAKKFFLEKFREVALKGVAGKWAGHIIEHFHEDAIGGGQYRDLFKRIA